LAAVDLAVAGPCDCVRFRTLLEVGRAVFGRSLPVALSPAFVRSIWRSATNTLRFSGVIAALVRRAISGRATGTDGLALSRLPLVSRVSETRTARAISQF